MASRDGPAEIGRQWAERRAEELRGDIPALDWPDVWPRHWDGPVDFPEGATSADAQAYREAAHHAAAARWAEILKEERDTESFEEEQADEEAQAVRLLELIRGDLPSGLTADRDGPRVFVRDQRGLEMTVTSLEHAWRIVSDYDERYTG